MAVSARFFGGPLDGREQSLQEGAAADGDVVTHVYLHGGPKIETRYRLMRGVDGSWEYRVLGG
ncbi:MAG: hypothetical protein ACRDRL_15315 [Sciscionella sp.]